MELFETKPIRFNYYTLEEAIHGKVPDGNDDSDIIPRLDLDEVASFNNYKAIMSINNEERQAKFNSMIDEM